jgi:zinc transport system substrate-binding protein
MTAVAAPPSRAADMQVVVTIKPVHAIAAAVMAGAGPPPRLLVDGAASPHTFTLKPSNAKALNAADVVIRVSETVEPFTVRLVPSLPKSVRLVTLDAIPGLTLHNLRSGAAFEAHAHGKHGHGHAHGPATDKAAGRDGHLWLDPGNAKLIASHLAETFAAVTPANSERYRANAAAFAAKVDALVPSLEAKLAPLAGKPYVVFHDAYQYFERRFALGAIGSVTVSPDIPASAKRLVELRTRIRQMQAVCVFAEPQFEPKLVETILEGTGARRGVLDPLGAALPAGPDLYPALLVGLADGLASCISGAP